MSAGSSGRRSAGGPPARATPAGARPAFRGRRRWWCPGLWLLLLRLPAATEFGGVVTGPETNWAGLLPALRAGGDLRWLRTASPAAADAGFDLVADLRGRVQPGLSPERDVLPDDLPAVYWRCRTNLPAFPGRRQAWEVWNEPDFYFVRDPAHAMAAVLKACWWGVKAGHPDAQVLMPSLAFRPGRYALELARNGALDYTEGWNWHFYGWAPEFRPVLAQQREFFRLFGREFPVWITEAGWFQMPAVRAAEPGLLARQAAFHTRLAAEALAEGVERYLPFALSPFTEARHDLGLAGPDLAPRPALESYLALTRELAGAQPRWELLRRGEPVGLCFALPDGRFRTFLWSPGRPEERRFGSPPRPVPANERWDTLVKLPDGARREVEITPAVAGDFVTDAAPFDVAGVTWRRWRPAAVPSREVRGFRDRAEAEAGLTPAEWARLRQPAEPSPVVLQAVVAAGGVADKAAEAYRVAPEVPVELRVRLHNFSEAAVRGSLEVELPAGWAVTAALSGPLELAPLSRLELRLSLVPLPAAGRQPVRFRWQGADGRQDHALLWLEAPPPRRRPAAFRWRDWHPPRENPAQWAGFHMGGGVLRLAVAAPDPVSGGLVAWAPLPARLRPDDVISGRVRLVTPRPDVYVQPFLATAAGEQTRHGELEALPPAGLAAAWRAGDFGPTIWSRVASFVLPDAARARFLVLRLQGARPGDEVELEGFTLQR